MAVNIAVLNSTTGFGGLCLQFTRLVFGVPALYATAYKAYLGAEHKHPGDTNPPYGVPVFWAPHDPGGAGHVAPSLGNGLVRTTNSATQTVYTVAISKITSAWGMPYLGWTEDLNGVRVWTPPAPAQEDDMLADERNMLFHIAALLGETPARTAAAVAAVPVQRVPGQPSTWLQDTVDGTTAALATREIVGTLTSGGGTAALSTADLARIAVAVADEQARRQAS